ncbi:SLAP domain-containing protein [Lactobacillus sp. ESL0225]|uniref:SLAP domain-containing protein n=1 Tax=Lactobacillus sp. ESL0225 TaxID=2069351 RepID=UPI000EFA7DE2|nr:SLAP domain-containing protein [Lactobacillus sp. ESL0225]RMC52042.1 hypothetical protein F5ESL0225_00805 [Lactobacillus sp. ESL0225]
MKKSKKLIASLAAVALATVPVITTSLNQAHAAQTTDQTQNKIATASTLTLNHNTRIYNKKGQKLYSYQGSNGLLKKGATVKYAAQVKAIDNPDIKRYSFPDNEWNWYYLPYKTIRGQEYYSISHGGYVKAINVDKINGNELYTNEATTTATQLIGKSVVLYDSQGNKTSKQLNLGQKVTLDKQANIFDLTEKGDGYNGGTNLYRIKGTNDFINKYSVKKIRQPLPRYTNYTDVLFVNDGYLYNAKGEKVIEKDNRPNYHKGGSITVTSMIDITDETTGKAVPFYRVADQYLDIGQKRSNECYIKISDTKIILGGNNLKVNN